MKLTLLDITQNILSSMDSDEVNSIGDTVESRQVAEIVRTTYFNIIARTDLPEHHTVVSLTPSNDPDYPVIMYGPSNVRRIEWIKYDCATITDTQRDYQYVTILPLQQFVDMVHQFSLEESNVNSFNLEDFTYFYKNDTRPCFCTILKDNIIIFDSYDNQVDNTLQESKIFAYGEIIPIFEMNDTFIPDLDDRQFPLLISEAKSMAFLELKQINNDIAIRDSRRHWSSLQRTKELNKTSDFDKLANFGRRGHFSVSPDRWIRERR